MKKSGLITLSLIQLIDSISYMVVAPSIIFYVLQVGGTMDQYGLILSSFSFASFVGKPLLGIWLDVGGNKFRLPYVVSISAAALGGICYFVASSFTSTWTAVSMIFIGRFLGGLGAANQALGYAYLASVIPPAQQTQTSSLLSMTRILGMAVGPAFNVLLQRIQWSIPITSTFTFELTPLNTVGLFLAVANIIAMLVVLIILEEPPESKKSKVVAKDIEDEEEHAIIKTLKALCCVELLLPMYTLFVVNSGFQLVETALTPAANHALGWGPVESSGVLGSTSVVIFGCMMIVFYLSSKKVPNQVLIAIGSILWVIGGLLMYLLWKDPAKTWYFIVPIMVAICGFPFIAPANRSVFTEAVDSKPELETQHGFMQALLSTIASAAGFMTPGFVAAFVLRKPEEVEASSDQRELNPIALYVPISIGLVLVGLVYQYIKEKKAETARLAARDEFLSSSLSGENTSLLNRDSTSHPRRYSAIGIKQRVRCSTEMNRRNSVTIMGIPIGETAQERIERTSVISTMDAMFEDDEEISNLDW